MNKSTVISIIIILATLILGGYLLVTKGGKFFNKNGSNPQLSSVQLKFTGKNLKLDFSAYPPDSVINIANFEKNEDWQGKHDFDPEVIWEGETSLLVESRDNEKVDVYRNEKLDLSKYNIFKLAIYLKSSPADTESVKLYFSNKDKSSYFVYPINYLSNGWNFMRIQKINFSVINAAKESLIKSKKSKEEAIPTAIVKDTGVLTWDKIERVGIEVHSRSNVVTTVNVDNLTALEFEDYLDDWLVINPLFLDLVKRDDGKVVLQAKNVSAVTAVIKKLSGISDLTFKAKLQPMKLNARSGLFIRGDYKTNYGYYFLIDGVTGNRWQILKLSLIDQAAVITTLKSGLINNFAIDVRKPVWLKVEAKKDNFKYYLSTNSTDYTLLGETIDNEFKEGGVGIIVYDSGVAQFDDMEFNQ